MFIRGFCEQCGVWSKLDTDKGFLTVSITIDYIQFAFLCRRCMTSNQVTIHTDKEEDEENDKRKEE